MSVSVSDRQRFETFSQQSGFGHQSRSTTAVIYQWWIPFSGDPSRDKLMYIYQLTNRSTEQFMQNRKQVKYLLNCPTLKNDTQARFHVLYLLRAQCFFFLLYFCAQKTSQSESPHRDCSSRIQRHTMAKTKVGKKQGAELCTVKYLL